MAEKKKYYVVWRGRKTGIFNTWAECEQQTKGFQGASFKSFPSLAEAEKAFKRGKLAILLPLKGKLQLPTRLVEVVKHRKNL